MHNPIKELGLHEIQIVLHPEVEAGIKLNVARSPEEAELQASGKSDPGTGRRGRGGRTTNHTSHRHSLTRKR